MVVVVPIRTVIMAMTAWTMAMIMVGRAVVMATVGVSARAAAHSFVGVQVVVVPSGHEAAPSTDVKGVKPGA